MAIPEACGLWIEQRVQEELDAKGDTGASLREIGRKVAAEVERYFETKVNPMAITMKASREQSVTNVTPSETSEITEEKVDASGCKIGPSEVVKMIEEEAKTAPSIRQAEKAVAKKTGKTESAVRSARQRAAKPKEQCGIHDADLSRVNGALSFATIAISTLNRIQKDDPFLGEAIHMIEKWIKTRRGQL